MNDWPTIWDDVNDFLRGVWAGVVLALGLAVLIAFAGVWLFFAVNLVVAILEGLT